MQESLSQALSSIFRLLKVNVLTLYCSLMSISELTPMREWEQDMIYWTNQTSKQIKEITDDIQ